MVTVLFLTIILVALAIIAYVVTNNSKNIKKIYDAQIKVENELDNELVSFGNYLLSEERKSMFIDGSDYDIDKVWDSDIENYRNRK